jgi:hypothetical protein
MDSRLKLCLAVVALVLAGAGAGLHRLAPSPRPWAAAPGADRFTAVVEPPLIHCRRAAQLQYDVAWASTCMALAERQTGSHAACMRELSEGDAAQAARAHCDALHAEADSSTDCTLPDDRAALLNAAYDRADAQCRAAFTQAAALRRPAPQNIVSW